MTSHNQLDYDDMEQTPNQTPLKDPSTAAPIHTTKSFMQTHEILTVINKLSSHVTRKSEVGINVANQIDTLQTALSSADSNPHFDDDVIALTLSLATTLVKCCPLSMKIVSIALDLVEHVLPGMALASDETSSCLFDFLSALDPAPPVADVSPSSNSNSSNDVPSEHNTKTETRSKSRRGTDLCQIAQTHPRFLRLLVCIGISIKDELLTPDPALVLTRILHYLSCHSQINAESRAIASGALQMLTLRLVGTERQAQSAGRVSARSPQNVSSPCQIIQKLIRELLPDIALNYDPDSIPEGLDQHYQEKEDDNVILAIFEELLGVVAYCLESKVGQLSDIQVQARKALAEGRFSMESFVEIIDARKASSCQRPIVSADPFIEGGEVVTALDIMRAAISKILEDRINCNNQQVIVWLRRRYIPLMIEFSALIGLVAFPLSVVLRVIVSLAALFATQMPGSQYTFGFEVAPEEYCLFIHFLACQISSSDQGALSSKRRHIVALQALIEHVMGAPHVLEQILKSKLGPGSSLIADCILRGLTRVTERLGYISEESVNITETVEAIKNRILHSSSSVSSTPAYKLSNVRGMQIKPVKSMSDVSPQANLDHTTSQLSYLNLFKPPGHPSDGFLYTRMAVGKIQIKTAPYLAANWRRSKSWMNLSAGQKDFKPLSDECAALIGATHSMNTGKILSKCRINLALEWFMVSVSALTTIFPAEVNENNQPDSVVVGQSEWTINKASDGSSSHEDSDYGMIACYSSVTKKEDLPDDNRSNCSSSTDRTATLTRALLKLGASLKKLPKVILEDMNLLKVPDAIDLAYASLSLTSYANGDFSHPIDFLIGCIGPDDTALGRLDDSYVFTFLVRLALQAGSGFSLNHYGVLWESVCNIISRACLHQRRSLVQWIMEDIPYYPYEYSASDDRLEAVLWSCLVPKPNGDASTGETCQSVIIPKGMTNSIHLPSDECVSTEVIAACILSKISNRLWPEYITCATLVNKSDAQRFFRIHHLFQAIRVTESSHVRLKLFRRAWQLASEFEALAYFESLSHYMTTQVNHLISSPETETHHVRPSNAGLILTCVNFLTQLCVLIADHSPRFIVNVFGLLSKVLLSQNSTSPLTKPLWDAMALVITVFRLRKKRRAEDSVEEKDVKNILTFRGYKLHEVKRTVFTDSDVSTRGDLEDTDAAEEIFSLVESTIHAKGSSFENTSSLALLARGLLHFSARQLQSSASRTRSPDDPTLLPLKAISLVWTLCDSLHSRNDQEMAIVTPILEKASVAVDESPFALLSIKTLLCEVTDQTNVATAGSGDAEEMNSFWALDLVPIAQKQSREVIIQDIVIELGDLAVDTSAPVRLAAMKSLTAILSTYASKEQSMERFCHELYSKIVKRCISEKSLMYSKAYADLEGLTATSRLRALQEKVDQWLGAWDEYKTWEESLVYVVEKSPARLRTSFLDLGLEHYVLKSGQVYDEVSKLQQFKKWFGRIQNSGHAVTSVKECLNRVHSVLTQDHSLSISQLLRWLCIKTTVPAIKHSTQVTWRETMIYWLTEMKRRRLLTENKEAIKEADLILIDGLADIIGKFGHSAYYYAIEKENSPRNVVSQGDVLQLTINGPKSNGDWTIETDKLFLWIFSALIEVEMKRMTGQLSAEINDESHEFIRDIVSDSTADGFATSQSMWIRESRQVDLGKTVQQSSAAILDPTTEDGDLSSAYGIWNSFMDVADDNIRGIKQARILGVPPSIISMTSFLCSTSFLSFVIERPYLTNGISKLIHHSFNAPADAPKSAVQSLWLQTAFQITARTQSMKLLKLMGNPSEMDSSCKYNNSSDAEETIATCLRDIMGIDECRTYHEHSEGFLAVITGVQYVLYHNLLLAVEFWQPSEITTQILDSSLDWVVKALVNAKRKLVIEDSVVTEVEPNYFQEVITFCLLSIMKCAIIAQQDSIIKRTTEVLNELDNSFLNSSEVKFNVLLGYFCLCDIYQAAKTEDGRDVAFQTSFGFWIAKLKSFIDELKVKVMLKRTSPSNKVNNKGRLSLIRLFSFRSESNAREESELSEEEKDQLLKILLMIRRGAGWKLYQCNNAKQQMIGVMLGSVEFDDKVVRRAASESLKVLIGLEGEAQ